MKVLFGKILQGGLVGKLTNKINARNEKDWEEVYKTSTQYRGGEM